MLLLKIQTHRILGIFKILLCEMLRAWQKSADQRNGLYLLCSGKLYITQYRTLFEPCLFNLSLYSMFSNKLSGAVFLLATCTN